MKRLRVNIPGRAYDIVIGAGLLRSAGTLMRDAIPCMRAFVVTDGNVAPLYGETLRAALWSEGIETTLLTVPPGEGSKSEAVLFELYDKMLEAQITRGDVIAALGGGVVGDLAGYAAATLLRGIPFVQIPTTLLAQADSSVGGKVAINHPRGKNLIGAFHQPKLVLADTDTLKTLPARELACGMAEVIKHGAIADADLFSFLEEGTPDYADIIGRNCDIKRRVVETDEFDTGGRFILNFGHTFGHAIEAQGGFLRYNHGEAVSVGMVTAAVLGEKLGVTKPGTSERLRGILTLHGLPVTSGETPDWSLALSDKKRDGDTLRLVLLKEIGEAVLYPIDANKLLELLQ